MKALDPSCETERNPYARREYAFATLLIAAAFVLRLWGIPKMHAWDENVYLQNAELICCGKTNYSEIDSRPPLLSLIYAGIFIFWHSDYAAWIVTALLNAIGSVFLYLGGRAFVGRIAAGIAALLLAFLPFFVQADRSLLTDGPALTLIALAFWLLVRALQKPADIRFALAGLALALSVLMRFGSLSSVGMLSLLLLAAPRKIRACVVCGIGFAAGLIPYLAWSRVQYGGFLQTFHNGWANFGGPGEPFSYYLKNFPAIFSWVALAGLLLCAAQTGDELFTQKRTGSRLWHAGYLWLWGVAVLCFFSSLSHKEVRYAMPVALPLLLLAGTGLGELLKRRQAAMRIASLALLASTFLLVFWPDYHSFDSTFFNHDVSEEMTVAEFLNRSVPPTTVLYTNQNYPDFAHYTNFKVEPLPHDGPDLYAELNDLPQNGILIAYREDDDGSPIGPDFAWVDANPHFQKFKEFPNLILYTYRTD